MTSASNREYRDIYYQSADGLRLYARDYEGSQNHIPLFCMHGLTRNSADFHDLAFCFPDVRIISVDQRGRGKSDRDPRKENYRPDLYCQDMLTLLEQLKLETVIPIGTSMGGLMTMMISFMKPGLFKAAVINDIGPEIHSEGLERLRRYVGKSGPFANWAEAAEAIKKQGPKIYPDFKNQDWLEFARRTCIETADGLVKFDYDPAISDGIKSDDSSAVPPDLWPLFESLFSIPVLLIRGEISDILSTNTAERMADIHPDCTYVNIPSRGHAPLLTEPVAIAAVSSFLSTHG